MKKQNRTFWAGYYNGKIIVMLNNGRTSIFGSKKAAREMGYTDIRPVKIVEVKK